MIPCLDIHTHHPAPQPEAVVSAGLRDFIPLGNQKYSLGFHPWDIANPLTPEEWEEFERKAVLPEVVAIGECGIDKIKGGPLFKQMLILNRQIEISEKIRKPLIIHDVKAHDIIVGLKRNLNPSQNWMVHGFRGKPSVAKMLTDAGIYLSFGEKFNPETLQSMPEEMILAETDESPLSIQEIISQLSACRGKDMTKVIEVNTSRFLFGNKKEENETDN